MSALRGVRGGLPGQVERGFTLVELLIVVAVIGIISAIAIINLQGALEKSRQRKTMAAIRELGTAIQTYDADLSHFPRGGITASELSTALSGVTFKRVDTQDGWGNDMIYTADASHYTVESYGRDGLDGPGNIGKSTSEEYDYDLVFADGQFLHSPEGAN